MSQKQGELTEKGIVSSGPTVDKGYRTLSEFAQVETSIAGYDKKVVEMESAKGITFAGLKTDAGAILDPTKQSVAGKIVYKITLTGELCSWQQSSTF